MKPHFLSLLVLILTITFISCGNDPVSNVAKTINFVEEEYAPDKRLARCDLKLSGSGKDFIIRGETTESEAIEAVNHILDSLGIVYKNEINLLPADTAAYKVGLVNVSVANLRQYTGHSRELVTQAWLGYPMKILRKNEGWYLVQGPDMYIGYIDDLSLSLLLDDEYKTWAGKPKWICTATQTWVYQDREMQQIKSDMVLGNLLVHRATEEGVAELEFPDGSTGYVSADDGIMANDWLSNLEDSGDGVIRTAETMLGIPYLWGGTSTKGMDCSGFTRTVFAKHGYLLERDASLQVKTGMELPIDSTFAIYQPGDLFFFGKEGLTKNFIKHVAIYMGNGKIIHATGKVKIESLKEGDPDFAEDRYDTWLEVRRILGTGDKEGVKKFEEMPYL